MNVLGFHGDGKLPLLSIAKLHAMHKARGDRFEVRILDKDIGDPADVQPRLGDPAWDLVYGSIIFERTKPLARELERLYPGIVLGGTGVDLVDGRMRSSSQLPSEAESIAPCFDGYPAFTDSLGFTSRGCRFDCSEFCVVPTKEGAVRAVATLQQLWRGPGHPKRILLLDNDFFGNENWPELIAECKRDGYQIAVIQGINLRMLGVRHAQAIASVPWMSTSFHRRRVYCAWDLLEDERWVFRGLDRLKAAGIAPDSIMIYMLVGCAAGETAADREYRRERIRAFGARPYPMPFVRDGELGRELRAYARFCTQRADLHSTWSDYWTKHGGDPRKMAAANARRRVLLPLFDDDDEAT